MKNNTPFILTAIPTYLLIILFHTLAQTNDFDSGSTGVDGDLIFDIANGAEQEFDHLAAGHEGIWHFNTIVIPEGVTVTFPTPLANATPPVIWLASGDIQISGILNLAGENGTIGTTARTIGSEAKGGPGGFAGSISAGTGYGPGGGLGQIGDLNGGTITGSAGSYANVYGNRFLQPLIGGSGGGGAQNTRGTDTFAGGGGGGGAILLSSSTQIIIDGDINCDGGQGITHTNNTGEGARGGVGSGGGIRLIADKILGTGTLTANPNGRIAIESFDVSEMTLSTNPFTYFLNVQPTTTFSLPSGTIRVVDIDGNGVAAPALGRTQNPDVFFANAGEVTVSLECSDIPLGTEVTVVVKSTSSGAAAISAQSTPLTGTLAQSTASAQLTVPVGRGVIHAYASY